MRTQTNRRPPAPPLLLHATLQQRIAAVAQQGLGLVCLARAIDSVLCQRTVFAIVAGDGRATATSLCGVNVLAEVIGGADRDERVVGLILDAPSVELVARALCRLAKQNSTARTFALQRLRELETLHGAFHQVVLPPVQQEARS